MPRGERLRGELALPLAWPGRGRGLALEHPVRLLGEAHKAPAEVLQPRVGVVFGPVVVLHGRASAQRAQKGKGGGRRGGGQGCRVSAESAYVCVCVCVCERTEGRRTGRTYREEIANRRVLNSVPEEIFFIEEEYLHGVEGELFDRGRRKVGKGE